MPRPENELWKGSRIAKRPMQERARGAFASCTRTWRRSMCRKSCAASPCRRRSVGASPWTPRTFRTPPANKTANGTGKVHLPRVSHQLEQPRAHGYHIKPRAPTAAAMPGSSDSDQAFRASRGAAARLRRAAGRAPHVGALASGNMPGIAGDSLALSKEAVLSSGGRRVGIVHPRRAREACLATNVESFLHLRRNGRSVAEFASRLLP